MLATASVAAIAVALPAPAMAQAASGFSIPARDLAGALESFARQSGKSIMFEREKVMGARSTAIKGRMKTEEALKRLLAGTGFTFEKANANTFVIKPIGPARVSDDSDSEDHGARPEILVTGQKGWTLNTDIRRTEDDSQPFVVFTHDEIQRSGSNNVEEFLRDYLNSNVGGPMTQTGGSSGQKGYVNLRGLGTDETLILVDGRRIAPINLGGGVNQPMVSSIPLSAVERIEVLASAASGIYGGSATGGVVNIILKRDYRGIDISSTMGSSYNGAAKNGRVDFSAGANLFGGGTRVMVTGSWQKTNPLYFKDADYLSDYGKLYIAANPSVVPFGTTPNIRSTTGANLVLKPAYGGQSLGSAITYVPVGSAGVASQGALAVGAGLLANAGQYNYDLSPTAQTSSGIAGAYARVLTGVETISGTFAVRQDVTKWLNLFVEAAGDQSKGTSVNQILDNTVITLAASAPNNPFQQSIAVTLPLYADNLLHYKTQGIRLTGGAVLKLPFGWSGAADYSWNRTSFDSESPRRVVSSQISGLSSGAIDIIRDVQAYPIAYQLTDVGSFQENVPSTARTASLRLAGPLPIGLPGGKPTLTMQLQRVNTTLPGSVGYSSAATGSSISYRPRRVVSADSAYFEGRIPIFSEANHIPFLNTLEFQVAGRYEKYSVSGTVSSTLCYSFTRPLTEADLDLPCPLTTSVIRSGTNSRSSFNPTFSVKWKPARDLMLRGSYATGYRPPSTDQLVSAAGSFLVVAQDPLRGNESIGNPAIPGGLAFVSGLTGGNPNLRPERATSYTAGFVLTPQYIPHLRLSVDWTETDKRDNYFTPSALFLANSAGYNAAAQTLFNQFLAAYPERFTRSGALGAYSVAPITYIDGTIINLARANIGALDFKGSYETAVGSGTLYFDLTASWLYKFKVQVAEGAPITNWAGVAGTAFFGAGADGGPEWRGSAAIRYANDIWSVGAAARYYDSYYFTPDHQRNAVLGKSMIPAQVYFDLNGSYRLFEKTEFRAGVRNLLNKQPPFDGTSYSQFGDPRRGTWYFGISQKF